MKLTELRLYQFRIFSEQTIHFGKRDNLLIGANGHGKSSIIEAIRLLSTGRSPRARVLGQTISFGLEQMQITAQVSKAEEIDHQELSFVLGRNGRRHYTVNGNPLGRHSELLGKLRTAIFSPQDIEIIAGGPQERRQFLDVILCQSDPEYTQALSDLRAVLLERNALLRGAQKTWSEMEIWTTPLLQHAYAVSQKRASLVQKLNAELRLLGQNTGFDHLQIDLRYLPGSGSWFNQQQTGGITQIVHDHGMLFYQRNLVRDIHLHHTVYGPHRDEISIHLNGKPIRDYGSQGEQRLTALLLKLAETRVLTTESAKPVLLIDDAVLELDPERQNLFWQISSTLGQRIITMTADNTCQWGWDHDKIRI